MDEAVSGSVPLSVRASELDRLSSSPGLQYVIPHRLPGEKPLVTWSELCGLPSVPLTQCQVRGQLCAQNSLWQGCV